MRLIILFRITPCDLSRGQQWGHWCHQWRQSLHHADCQFSVLGPMNRIYLGRPGLVLIDNNSYMFQFSLVYLELYSKQISGGRWGVCWEYFREMDGIVKGWFCAKHRHSTYPMGLLISRNPTHITLYMPPRRTLEKERTILRLIFETIHGDSCLCICIVSDHVGKV